MDSAEDRVVHQGAEARIYFIDYNGVPAVRKKRFEKIYRHSELDKRLTKARTRAEVKALQTLKEKCPSLSEFIPKVLHSSADQIILTRLVGFQTLHQAVVDGSHDMSLVDRLFLKTGKVISEIHKCGLIHGDLTTTNFMINIYEDMVPIDFGLSSFSTSVEDRAVDLYVFERSALTTGLDTGDLFKGLLASYTMEMGQDGIAIMKKLAEVQARGRKREMIG